MTLEDPFFIVKDEVVKSVAKTRGLYQRWSDLREDETAVGKEELEWTTTELNNSLRSIEWDLEDLEEAVGIAEKNPKKFKIDEVEIRKRQMFLIQTKEEVKAMKEVIVENKMKERKSRQNINISVPGTTKYTRLLNEIESPEHRFVTQNLADQKNILNHEIATEQSNLVKNEADEQAVMLGSSLGINIPEPQVNVGSSKITQALHLTTGKRQWLAIGVLSGMMVVVVTLIVLL